MKSISKLKKELDKWFSLYIRLRESTIDGVTQCFTCGKIDYHNKLQCGHFQSRRHLATRWDEQNCQVQCVGCNMFKAGEQFKFHLNLNAKYGEDTSINLQHKAMQSVKITRVEYQDYISYYKEAVENLKKEKGIE
tara:strand:- start:142 stop:546 length:405 start_codon:yes stop_codon:yes gene_type:complete